MNRIIILFLLGFFDLNAQLLNPLEAKKDLFHFRVALNRYHPELYRYIDSTQLAQEFEKVNSKINDPINSIEFYNFLRGLGAKIKDGHLKFIPNGKDQDFPFYDQRLFPLQLYFEKNRTYTIGAFENLNIPNFFEILSINGVDINEIKNNLMAHLTFGDGESVGGKYYQLNRFFSGYYSSQYGTSDQYVIEGKISDQLVTYTVKSTSKNKIDWYYNSVQPKPQLKIIDKNRAILTIPRFYSLKGETKLRKFLKESFVKLKKEGVSKLIIDVRGNEGGNEKFGIELYQYIAREPFMYYSHLSVMPNSKGDYKSNTSKLFLLANSFSRNKNGSYIFPFGGNGRIYKPKKIGYQGEEFF